MGKTSYLQDREMYELGFVAITTACTQYGVTRAQMMDLILDGKVASRKPGPTIYVKWQDCLANLGKPADYRALTRGEKVVELVDLPLMDGMLAPEDIAQEYREEAKRPRRSRSNGGVPRAQPPSGRFTIRPAEDEEEEAESGG